MQQNNSASLKKIILLFLLTIAFMLFGQYMYSYLLFGRLVIHTNDHSNLIKISGTSNNNSFEKNTTGNIKINLKPGIYRIVSTDSSGGRSIAKQINISRRQKIKADLTPPELSSPQPFYSQPVDGLMPTTSQVIFLDSNTHKIKRVDSANRLSDFAPGKFESLIWANEKLGVAKTVSGDLYKVTGASVNKINTGNITPIDAYGITNKGEVYIANKTDVYLSTLGGKNFSKVFSSKQSGLGLVVGQNKALVVEPAEGEEESMTVNILSGEKAVAKNNLALVRLAWSPNGNNFFVGDKRKTTIYNSQFDVTDQIFASNVSTMSWKDDKTLYYSIENQLWKYDLQTHTDSKIATLPYGQKIGYIFASNNSNYLYLATSTEDKSSVLKFSLAKTVLDDPLLGLDAFMPENIDTCSLNYINFTSPTIMISSPNTTSSDDCVSATKGELSNYGFDPAKFKFLSTQYSVSDEED